MTPTERRAYLWLQAKQGYAADEITFHHSVSPDFTTSDGKGWEVKRLVSQGYTTFTMRQVVEFHICGGITVLFWREGATEPERVADFLELPLPGLWKGYSLKVTVKEPHYPLRWATGPAEVQEYVAVRRAEGPRAPHVFQPEAQRCSCGWTLAPFLTASRKAA